MKLSNGQFGFGQILWRKGLKLRIGIFKLINDSELIDIENLEDEGFIIIENTVRTFFKLNRWKVIGTLQNKNESHGLMLYKVHSLDGMVLMDISGNIVGKASANDQLELEYEKSYSPISFSRALEVFHKIVEYDSYYEKMFLPHCS
jgi:hypothetical protein